AVAADRVVMVVAGRVDPLVPGGAAADLDPLHQAELLELLQRPVDRGAADRRLAPAQLVVEVERGDRAVVFGEGLDHRGAGATAPVAGVGERGQRVLGPVAPRSLFGRLSTHVPILDPGTIPSDAFVLIVAIRSFLRTRQGEAGSSGPPERRRSRIAARRKTAVATP